jgi:ribonucleotide reductase alpha subunit
LDYDNDMNRGYASVVQLESKYLIKDVKDKDILLEMPQETFMIIPMVIFADENANGNNHKSFLWHLKKNIFVLYISD